MAPLDFQHKNLIKEIDIGYNDSLAALEHFPEGNSEEFFENMKGIAF